MEKQDNIIKKFEELTQYEKDIIQFNGCGGKSSAIKPPYALFFESSCLKHDYSYWIGGTEEDRITADIGFFKAMLKDCERLTGLQKTKYIIWSHLYFIAVRTFGWKYFYYTNIKRTI